MYFPYLRGKQFEIEALIEVPAGVYKNTLPIVEPVTLSRPRLYETLATQRIPFILVLNPFYPAGSALPNNTIQTLINTQLATHPSLRLGFLIDSRFSIVQLNTFFAANPTKGKALIVRNNPLQRDLTAIQAAINAHPVDYIVFDDTGTNATTRAAFAAHGQRVLLTDGFQRHDRNIDYPAESTFSSNYSTYNGNGWYGIGDYLTIGDHFQPGGGPVYVVALHVTKPTPQGLEIHHFSSTINQAVKGLGPQKFSQANTFLVTSPATITLATTGIDYFRDWHVRAHNPQLGAAKKASIIHHIEIMSGLV